MPANHLTRAKHLLLALLLLVPFELVAQDFRLVTRDLRGNPVTSYRIRANSDLSLFVLPGNISDFIGSSIGFTNAIILYNRGSDSFETIPPQQVGFSPNGSFDNPAISATGRYVAFGSTASNLGPVDTNLRNDCYFYDRVEDSISLFSVSSTGAPGNERSCNFGTPVISDDGNLIAFSSLASNLVPNDTNSRVDIFVRSRLSEVTNRVSVSSSGAEANAEISDFDMSGDGRYIVFTTAASTLSALVSSVTGIQNVYLHDRATGETELISLGTDFFPANGSCREVKISGNGRYVVYSSTASNLVTGDSNGQSDVFLYDRETGRTEILSKGINGEPGNNISVQPDISADGRFVSFSSLSTNLLINGPSEFLNIYLLDRVTGNLSLSSIGNFGNFLNNSSFNSHISDDGSVTAFQSGVGNILAANEPRPSGTPAPLYVGRTDECPSDPIKSTSGTCGCGVSDADLNLNGSADCLDPLADSVPSSPVVQLSRRQLIVSMQAFPNSNVSYVLVARGKTSSGRRVTLRSTGNLSEVRLRRKRSVKRWSLRYRVVAGSTRTKPSKRTRVKS